MSNSASLTGARLWAMAALRILIGWHLLYEGIAKLWNPYWTSAGFLADSQGPLAGLYLWMAGDPGRLTVVDVLNQWGLTLIGLALILGVFSRFATLMGAVLLGLYYLGTPPWPGIESSAPAEGSYLIVNKTLIECVAMIVLWLFPTGHQVGFDAYLTRGGNR
ncbi:MAG: DoxX subfamily [Acidobacteria bacterium]|nr:DoxX subfamily [Acidobacteriota bacterium]